VLEKRPELREEICDPLAWEVVSAPVLLAKVSRSPIVPVSVRVRGWDICPNNAASTCTLATPAICAGALSGPSVRERILELKRVVKPATQGALALPPARRVS
jgi:hypothetical protein